MKKSKFYVVIKTTFKVEETIEATSEEEAIEIATKMVCNGDINPTDTLDFETEYDVWKGE